jgi:hypothetical protein
MKIKSSSSLKAVVAILAILLVGSLVYIFKLTSDTETVKTELKTTLSDKETVMKDLKNRLTMLLLQKTHRCLMN